MFLMSSFVRAVKTEFVVIKSLQFHLNTDLNFGVTRPYLSNDVSVLSVNLSDGSQIADDAKHFIHL